MSISHVVLQDDSVICLSALEITSIPDIMVTQYHTECEAYAAYTERIGNVLNEVFQTYKAQFGRQIKDIAIELLWLTEPVEQQIYSADIRLILIFRCVSDSRKNGSDSVNKILNIFKNILEVNKYSTLDIEFSELQKKLQSIKCKNAITIVKEPRVERLQVAAMPQVFCYDSLSPQPPNIEILVNTLLRHPNSIVSIQLIPTSFTPKEANLIDLSCQSLGMLSKGTMSPGWGMAAVESAQQGFETYQYYNNNRARALFAMNLIVCGENEAVDDIAASLRTQLNGERKINMYSCTLDPELICFDNRYYLFPWVFQDDLPKLCAQRFPVTSDCVRLPLIITSEEAATLIAIPIGGSSVRAGFKINESEQGNRKFRDNLIDSGDITVGVLKNNTSTIGFSLKDLTKHMLVVGMPGSGKTTFSVGLLDRLWKDHNIPFLVIEPAKNEYRALIKSIPELQIFTPGKNTVSPFVFNPFVVPDNVKLESYKSTLKTAFAAAVSMTTPLDKIFEASINNCYSDFKWLDTYTSADKGQIFNISDFIKCFEETFQEIGYTGDAKNIGRAGVVRLNSLVNLFDYYFSIPIKDILEKPTVIELAAIENSEQKSLIISLLLLSILSYVNANYQGTGELKNLILLEEAHVLLASDGNTDTKEANPTGIAQNLLKRMLAEIRAYGVGIMIADQSPRKVTTDVVALTDMKVVFRLVENTDKTIIGDSMNMSEAQVKRLSRLKPGEAFLFFNRLDEPEEIVTPDYRLDNNIAITLTDESIHQQITYWKDKEKLLRPYPQCALCRYCTTGCDYNRRVLAKEIARRIFRKNFHASDNTSEPILSTFKRIVTLTKEELNGEPFSPELFICVKVHLWRNIKYGTKIPLSDSQIEKSILK